MRFPLALGCLTALVVAASAADWPQWHGPTRDRHAPSPSGSAALSLPTEFTPVWKVPVGPGHASPVVAGAHLIHTDCDGTNEVIHCLDAATGREIWHASLGPQFEDEWGPGPRSSPFLDDERVYAQTGRGEFFCLDRKDGRILWSLSYDRDFGVVFDPVKRQGASRRRGHNGCGLLDGDAVILPVGSTNNATLVACDKRTGARLWQAGNDETAYSSPVVATLHGTRQVVFLGATLLMGVERTDGKVLWSIPVKTAAMRHAATPVVIGNRIVVNSHSYGMAAMEVTREGDEWTAAPAWINPDLKINIATATRVGDHLYTQGPDRDYVCIEAATGRVCWSEPGFGTGKKDYSSTLAVGNRLLALTEDGTLLLLEPNPEAYTELQRLQVCGSTWCFPALAGSHLFLRDGRSLLCLELGP